MSDRTVPRSRASPTHECLAAMIAAIFVLGSSGIVAAQSYPARTITVIVPFAAGGATDTLARYLSDQMRAILSEMERWWPIIKAANDEAERRR